MTTTPRLALPEPLASDLMSISPPAFATIWSNVDGAIGPTFCTSATKPASPYACEWIYLTDTGAEQVWDPIASAWVTIKHNPTGIVAINNSLNTTGLAAASTEYMVATIQNLTVEPFKNYRVHAEGIVGFMFDGTKAIAQPTQNSQLFMRYTNTATVTTAGTQFSSHCADAMQSGTGYQNNITAQQNFAFDGIYTGTSATTLSVGWSYELNGSLSANTSAQYVQNTLMYVEEA